MATKRLCIAMDKFLTCYITSCPYKENFPTHAFTQPKVDNTSLALQHDNDTYYNTFLGDMLDQSISPIEFVQILFIYLFIYLFISSFCMNFVVKISQKRKQQSCSNFHTILAMIRNRPANKFSLITQPWHHPGAILCFHIIIHIFITIYQKLIKFDTHKLEVMGQYIDPSPSPCASQRARQNFKMLKI